MSDINAQIETMQRQINSLEAKLRGFESFEFLSKKAIVGAKYVAMLYGCSETAVRRGRCGTRELRNKRVRFNPDGWQKEVVDAAHKEFIKTAPERAIEAEKAANKRKRK